MSSDQYHASDPVLKLLTIFNILRASVWPYVNVNLYDPVDAPTNGSSIYSSVISGMSPTTALSSSVIGSPVDFGSSIKEPFDSHSSSSELSSSCKLFSRYGSSASERLSDVSTVIASSASCSSTSDGISMSYEFTSLSNTSLHVTDSSLISLIDAASTTRNDGAINTNTMRITESIFFTVATLLSTLTLMV